MRIPKNTHVAVLMGGWSPEREVSLRSGDACGRALESAGFRVTLLDVRRDIAAILDELRPDVAFNALHGKWGEDGTVQGILETLEIPYTHSGVLASAVAMHKEKSKCLFRAAEIPVAENIIPLCELAKNLAEAGDFENACETLQPFWAGLLHRPDTAGLPQDAEAELLLRTGTLTGWLGSAKQIAGAQEAAKDLISESASIFETLGNTEKIAEARVDLAICYWREGALDEARVTLRLVLDSLGAVQSRGTQNAGDTHLGFDNRVEIANHMRPYLSAVARPGLALRSMHALNGEFRVLGI